MLCSHVKRFIYLKTFKTAGTSAEIFFERHCCTPSLYNENHEIPETITDDGIIGYRGRQPSNSTFFNHMPAYLARNLLGENIWSSYFKFCVIRNPFDKVVSMFWMHISEDDRANMAKAPFEQVRLKFSEYISDPNNLPNDRHIFTIDNEVAVDFFIRFENYTGDIKKVCERLGIETPIEKVGRYKAKYRKRSENFREYYTKDTAKAITDFYRWEIDYFNYGL